VCLNAALGDLSDTSISATGDVPPKFTQLLKDIEGTEGELVRFECRVIGQPTPTIKWYCGRNQVENSPDFQVTIHTLITVYFSEFLFWGVMDKLEVQDFRSA